MYSKKYHNNKMLYYNKYRNHKAEADGITFDSIKERDRYLELKLMEKAGEITDLELQKEYILIPKQYSPSTLTKQGKEKRGRLLERECKYRADFVYKDISGNEIVEDTKGMRTPDYLIKRKLMLFVHGIKITEL